MKRERWLEANAVFESIVDLPAEERAAALDRACSGEPSLREVVERLLRADAEAEAHNFLSDTPELDRPPAGGGEPGLQRPEEPPTIPERIGAYRIVKEIGRGGMGTIYEAARDDGTMDQRVAVKVVRTGLEGDDIARRMRQERRILARLEHPNVARIYDAGATPSGSPFFVMELVDGLPIDDYCSRHRLPLEARLELILEVCRAVSYANDKLVVHRDIKASNILVTPDGEPKLLDFGIAKVLEEDPRAQPAADQSTEPWQRRMTLEYASPEHIRGLPVSLGCDVYSLGVLLFLLLTGDMPRSAEGLTPWLFERRLLSTDPPLPSRRVAASDHSDRPALGARFSLGAAQLEKRLSGDLDSIVLGALQEDPQARYGSAKELAEDLERYLTGFPVRARHGSSTYRLGKFLRRHVKAVAAGLLISALSIGLMISVVQSGRRAEESRLQLLAENERRQRTLDVFLDIFAQAGPLVSEGVDLTLRQAVDRFLETSAEKFPNQPEAQGDIFSTLGWIYLGLGAPEQALTYHQKALDLREKLGEPPKEIVDSLVGVAAATRDRWRLDEAEAISLEAMALIDRTEDLPAALRLSAINHHVGILCHKGDWEAAEPLTRDALLLSRALGGAEHYERHIASTQRARVVRRLGRLDEAEDLYRAALADLRESYGPGHPLLPLVNNNLGEVAYRLEQFDRAMTYWRRADRQYAEIYGEDYYNRSVTLNSLGRALIKAGRLTEAEAALKQAVHVAQTSPALGPRHERRYFGTPATKLAELWIDDDRCAEVLDLLAGRYPHWKDHKVTRRAREQVELCRERTSGKKLQSS